MHKRTVYLSAKEEKMCLVMMSGIPTLQTEKDKSSSDIMKSTWTKALSFFVFLSISLPI